ncbi:MAG: hypothetical protein F4Y78_03300 [Candidatus Dadabacteria bacterium]|nr:hypothetical protein [Candidatus Dadabacteria bacterium]MYA49117.1 hypothetical protein [Candidatus Dadabacteria bacterium]MYF47508.1 hypothetical protein [Candidatus Dadabacteria bacterium]MYG82681.1 hypothetical protein [Candidatus Dadabacteria bacterium]MYK48949.1 hypothetical protein [Candidatus Dadabacteria bacterium]
MIERIKRESRLICLIVILLIAPFSYAEAWDSYGSDSWDSYDSELEDDRPGFPVYEESECIGPVINGVCHGGVIDTNPMRERCYGDWLMGECTGPQF